MIILAKSTDAPTLTNITLAAKAHWGYSPEQMQAWTEELTITASYILKHPTFLLLEEKTPVAYYSCFEINKNKLQLDNLFVLPEKMGSGYGRLLLTDCIERAKQQSYKTIRLDADPHATAFYQHMGFKIVGQLASSIPGRFLPIMEQNIAFP